MSNKTIIGFGFRMIWKIMQTSSLLNLRLTLQIILYLI